METAPIRDYLIEFQKTELPEMIPRELTVRGKPTLINTIIGPRRAGKTYLLYQLMQNIERDNVLYLNFEDTRLLSISFKDFLDVVNLHTELFNTEPRDIFLDEVQNVAEWERGVRTLFDRRKFNIILTGSSSKLLAREIATQLRGRAIKHLLLPYSFREFLVSQGIEVPKLITDAECAKLKNCLSRWLEFGGYPEVVKTAQINEKIKILESYKELIIYRDIIERYHVKSPFVIKLLIELLIDNFAKEFSVNSFFNTLKSKNIKVSKKTLYTYLSFIEDSLAIFQLTKWTPKLKEQRLVPKKVYLCDNALAYRQKEELGRRMENAVFIELKNAQNLNPLLEIYYWKDHQQHEVDFLLKEGRDITQLIQVTSAETRAELKAREITNLQICSKETKCLNLVVITWGYEHIETYNSMKIKFIPLWKWLISEHGFG